MIKNIGWTLGNDCPCKCKHCYSFTVRKKGQNLTKEIVDKVINQIQKLNVETVNLGGNEPIFTNGLDVHKSMLPYILKELNKRNIKVGITTAGISLIALKNTYPECLKLLNDVDISFDSPYEKEHNENRGGDVYKYAIQALEICKENNYEKIEGCKDCDKADICRGGCFAMAYTYKKCETGEKDLYARDPFCLKDIEIDKNINYRKANKQLVHENYLCTWIGKPKK